MTLANRCVAILALVLVTPTFADDSSEKGNGSGEARLLKVFKLKHLPPQEAQAAVGLLAAATPGVKGVPALPAVGLSAGNLPQPPAMAVNVKAKAVLVRGTKEQVEKYEKVLAALDRPLAEIATTKFDGGTLYALKHATATEVVNALNQLQISAQLVPVSQGSLVFVAGQSVQDDAQEVIKTIDIPDEPKAEAAAPVSGQP
jgi:type II secretory pathway component GspD/PulD (secretin)